MVKQDQLNEAVIHFLEIVTASPNSLQANLGLAQTLVKAMQQHGSAERNLYLLRQCIDRIRALDPSHDLLPTLAELFRQFSGNR